jgi:hypothetical protein
LSRRRKSMKRATTRICMCLRVWLKSKNQEEFRKNTVSGLITKCWQLNNDIASSLFNILHLY